MDTDETVEIVRGTLADMAEMKELRLDPLRERIRDICLDVLRVLHQEFSGRELTLPQKQKIAFRVHALLDENGLRPACLECNEPAILRANSKLETGSFLFDHYVPKLDGKNGEKVRTNHGCYLDFPLITTVVNAPKRGRRNGAAAQVT